MNTLRILTMLLIFLFIISCGSSGGSPGDDDDDNDNDTGDTINTEKLIGTPFEGMTRGDDFDWDFFLCGQYRTETITGFPIKVFAAFFTATDEEFVQEGIDLANEGIGFTAYELTDTWTDDVRVIYDVSNIESENGFDPAGATSGITLPVYVDFNGKQYAEKIATDWAIELNAGGELIRPVVAHELGHASGIPHALIDYENDSLTDLEEGSLMSTGGGGVLTDYNFMMEMQGQIMINRQNDSTGLYDHTVEDNCP